MEDDRAHDINKTFSLDLEKPLQLPSSTTSRSTEIQLRLPYCAKHGVPLPIVLLHDDALRVGRVVHNCTALNEAVIFGQVERVKALLAAGASMTVQDCTGSTAVSEAAYHNQVEAMKLMLDSGADVNIPNKFGLTPLSIASSSYKGMMMVSLLLKRGANVNVKARDGRSALHLAAEGGHRWIAKKLLRCESIDLDSICQDKVQDGIFCPSPLLLAASEGHIRVMEMLLNHFPFTSVAIIDSYLVLWAVFNLNIAQVKSPSDCDNYCRYALKMREESDPQAALPVIDARSFTEMKNTREFDELLLLDRMERRITKARQCIIILERCLGPHSKLLVVALRKTASLYARKGNLYESDRLLTKALGIMAKEEQELMEHGINKLPVQLHVVVTSFMEKLWKIWSKHGNNTASDYMTDFVPFIRNLLQVFETLLQLKVKQQCAGQHSLDDMFEDVLIYILTLLSCGIAYSVFLGMASHREELELVGQEFVMQYKDYCSQHFTSLVHLAVSRIDAVLDGMRRVGASSGDLGEDSKLLVTALLQWGALDDLNAPYCCSMYVGERLLRRAVLWAGIDPCLLSLVNLLIDNGAHCCPVNYADILPSEVSSRPELIQYFQPLLQSPHSLTCAASKVVLASGINYQSSRYISSSMKKFISYHDSPLIHLRSN